MALPQGVPTLLDPTVAFLSVVNVLTEDLFTGYGDGQPPLWGLYLGALPVVVADTVTEFQYNQAWNISDYPVERGGFESYDKVNSPFRVRIRFVAGGSEANRQALLDSITAIGDELTLYTAVTPTAIYPSMNVESFEYHRSAQNGLGLLTVDVTLIEIREDNTTNNFQSTRSPASYQAAPTGNVQSQDVPYTGPNLGPLQPDSAK